MFKKLLIELKLFEMERRQTVMVGPLKIVIPGRPVPKERPRLSAAGRKMYIYTPQETSKFEKQVALAALTAANGKVLFGDIAISIKLYFSDKRFGDLDNYAKSILDGLQGTLFENDKQVARMSVERYIDKNERAEVYVEEVSDE
ncbi:RusA family crossover junction endodeoxyribonuclease [Thermoanaerobacter thermohydrosulfuricus]|nr:RusA family crossover junction endodeoxyribonuclease [Thermoanaerobacter thermohydrosulfuricus]